MAFKISLADALFKSYSKIVTELEIQHNVKLKPTKGEADKLLSYQRKRKWVWKKAGGWKRNKLLEKTPEFLWQVNDVGFQNQVPTENGHLPKQDEEPAAEKQTLQNHVDPSKVVPASVAKACERRRLANSNVTKSPTEASSHCARRQHWREPCPQVGSMRRGSNESHHWRHPFYSDMGCDYCDFSAQENHLMMEHYRVHFRPGKHVKAESYTELVNLEVFMKEVNAEEDAILEDACAEVDISTHDVLLSASDWDESRPEPEPAGAEAPVLVDVFTGEFASEKRQNDGRRHRRLR